MSYSKNDMITALTGTLGIGLILILAEYLDNNMTNKEKNLFMNQIIDLYNKKKNECNNINKEVEYDEIDENSIRVKI